MVFVFVSFVEFVKKEGLDELKDVRFGGVVLTEFTAGFLRLRRLEEGTENGGTDFTPVEQASLDELFPHRLVEVRDLQGFAENAAVDVRKSRDHFIGFGKPSVDRLIQRLEQHSELAAQIRAVLTGARLDVLEEEVTFPQTGIISEQGKEGADQKN